MNARDVYESTGDAAAALQLLLEHPSKKNAYNEFLCQSMVSQRKLSTAWLDDLQAKEQRVSEDQHPLNNWILTYNRGLSFLSLQKPNETWNIVWPLFESQVMTDKKLVVDNSDDPSKEELVDVACHIAVLLLQALLEPNFTSSSGEADETKKTNIILKWLQMTVTTQAPLKFLLTVTKSRMELSGPITDNNIRSARKELKLAMEIFQHKLKTPENEKTAKIINNENSALNLKANTERLKGNIKKSLILLAGDDDDARPAQSATNKNTDLDRMHHYNNLALVYHTNGNQHLALHAWSKALSFATSEKHAAEAILQPNGTAQPRGQISILFNASLNCLQKQNYKSSYECMALVVAHWDQRADCWLRLAEACIGWNAQLHNQKDQSSQFQTSSNNQGKPNGIVLEPYPGSKASINAASLASTLGSRQDMELFEENPLPQARVCLKRALRILKNKKLTQREEMVLLSARLSLSYVCLEQRDYPKALEMAELVLASSFILPITALSPHEEEVKNSEGGIGSSRILRSMVQRQVATARMYASEAACAMKDTIASMKYLVGDNGKDDAIDRLASDLAGVTLEIASDHPQGKIRLAKAQAMVRCSASAVSANLNHLASAKQLAMSAQAMEGAYMSSTRSEASYARRVLIYCMLRDDNAATALTLLRSAR